MLSLWRQTLFTNPVLCNISPIYKECDIVIKIIYCLDVKSTVHYFKYPSPPKIPYHPKGAYSEPLCRGMTSDQKANCLLKQLVATVMGKAGFEMQAKFRGDSIAIYDTLAKNEIRTTSNMTSFSTLFGKDTTAVIQEISQRLNLYDVYSTSAFSTWLGSLNTEITDTRQKNDFYPNQVCQAHIQSYTNFLIQQRIESRRIMGPLERVYHEKGVIRQTQHDILCNSLQHNYDNRDELPVRQIISENSWLLTCRVHNASSIRNIVYIEKFPRQLEKNIDTLEFPLQPEKEEESKDEETESEDEHTPPPSRENSPAPSDAARDPVQSAQDDQLESVQEPPTPREASGSTANPNSDQQPNAHTPMQPIPRQVDTASPGQLSTGTPLIFRLKIVFGLTSHGKRPGASCSRPPRNMEKPLSLGLVRGTGRGKPSQGTNKIKVLVSDNRKPVVLTKAE